MTIITGFTVMNTLTGTRISYSYSEVDDDTGTVTKNGERGNAIVTDEETESKITDIKNYIKAKIAAQEEK